MSIFGKLFGKSGEPKSNPVPTASPKDDRSAADAIWDCVNAERKRVFEQHFGAFPQDILKLGDLFGVWPGGGLYVIPAHQLGGQQVVYTTFGLSNPNMPTTVMLDNPITANDGARHVSTSGTLKKKENARPRTERPGYGYEIMFIANENTEWPLWVLQWAAKAEILKDADLLGLVEKHQAMTVEKIGIGNNQFVHLLIAKAQAPLLQTAELPNGRLVNLVATVITEDEMQRGRKNGGMRLLDLLRAAGIGQTSVLNRQSVIDPPSQSATEQQPGQTDIDFSLITSLALAQALQSQGKLVKILTFPAELGGADNPLNVVYIPPTATQSRDHAIRTIQDWAGPGTINRLDVRPEYKGSSFVPSKIHMVASHDTNGAFQTVTIDIW